MQHRHHASRMLVQILAHKMLQQAQFNGPVGLGNPDRAAEIANRFRRIAAAANTADGRHARIIPAAHMIFSNQLQQLALAEQGVSHVQPVELDLPGVKDAQVVHKPVVKRSVIFELQRADGMRNAFDGIRLPVRIVVHRIDAPLVAGAVMFGMQNAVHHRVAHVEVGRRHVDPGPQRT